MKFTNMIIKLVMKGLNSTEARLFCVIAAVQVTNQRLVDALPMSEVLTCYLVTFSKKDHMLVYYTFVILTGKRKFWFQ